MLSFPTSPTIGQQFQTWSWDGTKWSPTSMLLSPDCGYFGIVGSSPSNSVRYAPLNGDLIRINGINYKIPAAGITAAYNNCFVNGVAGQTLGIGGTYFVYAFLHATLGVQLDFKPRLTGSDHVPSTQAGNVGTEIYNGDNSRSLVGMVYTGGGAGTPFYDQTSDRLTRSWFNRRAAGLLVGGGGVFGSPSYTLQTVVSMVAFAGESATVNGSWYGTADTWNNANIIFNLMGVGYVGTSGAVTTVHTTAAYENMTAMASVVLTNDGLNQLGLYCAMGAGSCSGSCAINGELG
jgi:hypothetical protein